MSKSFQQRQSVNPLSAVLHHCIKWNRRISASSSSGGGGGGDMQFAMQRELTDTQPRDVSTGHRLEKNRRTETSHCPSASSANTSSVLNVFNIRMRSNSEYWTTLIWGIGIIKVIQRRQVENLDIFYFNCTHMYILWLASFSKTCLCNDKTQT